MMSITISPIAQRFYGLKRVCQAWDVSRSTCYLRRKRITNIEEYKREKPGPKPKINDGKLLEMITEDITKSPFKGEGHRKIHARLRRQSVHVGKNRVLSSMKANNLLSPHGVRQPSKGAHDGTIITDKPNVMWCSDGTKLRTLNDGWVWIFSVEEHWNAECLGWHVCKMGDRFAALEPVTAAVKKVYGSVGKGVATGLTIRVDNGSQYTSDYFLQQIAYMGIKDSFGLVRQPQTNGDAERFNRTLKDQILHGRAFQNIEEVRDAVRKFVEQYNSQWLLEKLGYQSPIEARESYYKLRGAA